MRVRARGAWCGEGVWQSVRLWPRAYRDGDEEQGESVACCGYAEWYRLGTVVSMLAVRVGCE